ncbi:MAG: flagellin [Bdellovibrionota bacterium]|nr:flagellin FliC [Pseudobdellovibrionaceae bacterium]|tara:strand:- start:43103 stop:43939 length:837 start_codon:yes stop_codon:yes gene_type:complete
MSGLRVSTNVASLNAQNSLAASQRKIDKTFAQLSSGDRITKAADDAAGLALSESLKAQVKGYSVAQRNAMDGQSMVQVAEGGLNEVSNILVRLRELGVQAASDTVGDRERQFLDKEVQQLKLEMDRIAQTTKYGTTNLLDGSGGEFSFQIDINNDDFQDRITFDSGAQSVRLSELSMDGLDYSTKEGAREALTVIDDAQFTVNGHRATLGAVQNRLISTQNNLGTAIENVSAANSRIRDTDIAQATAELTQNQVLLNASTGILAQANAQPQSALRLIG